MIAKSLFVSNDLSYKEWILPLTKANWQVRGQSLLKIHPIQVSEIPTTDWIAFYSAEAVNHFVNQFAYQAFNNIARKGQDIINLSTQQRIQISSIGIGTAKKLQAIGLKVDHVGNGQPQEWAASLQTLADKQSILTPQASNSREALLQFKGAEWTVVPLVCYQNIPLKNVELATEKYLLFTSPLNVEAYFSQHDRQLQQVIMSIGPTTAVALQDWGIIAPIVPPNPSFSHIFEWMAAKFEV